MTISGTGFTSATAVAFAGIPAQAFTVVNDSTITATVGSGATGTITVTNPTGTATSSDTFIFFPAPTIYTFTPFAGGTGTVVTITGLYLGDAVAVAFGGTPATTFTVVDDYNITATVGDGETGPITVTTPGGTAVSAMEFTYLPTPQITSYVELAKDFLPITQSISALTDYGAGLSSDGTNYVPIFNKPNGTWSWQLCEDNQTQVYGGNGLWYWYGLGTYTDTSPYPSITMMDSGFWYPSMNTTVMNGIVAARRSLPGNLAYDDPATAQQGVPY